MKRGILIILLVQLFAFTLSEPVGECPAQDGQYPEYLPDSDKCNIFYECSGGKPVEKECMPGLVFNPTLSVCDWPEVGNDCLGGSKINVKSLIARRFLNKMKNMGLKQKRSPVGECPDKDPANPVYLPDSEKCTIYYECSSGTPIQNECSPGLHWNPTLNTCDFPAAAGCEASTPSEPETTTSAGSQTTTQASSETKHGRKLLTLENEIPEGPVGKCPGGNTTGNPIFLPDEFDCTIYYECDGEIPIKNVCSPGLEWNPTLNTCDFPEVAGCKASSTTKGSPTSAPATTSKPKPHRFMKSVDRYPRSPVGECPDQDPPMAVYLPDSKNCTLYYECSGGIPIQNHCSEGLEWNPQLNTCDFPDQAGCTASGNPNSTKSGPAEIMRKKFFMRFERASRQRRSPVGDCPDPSSGLVLLPDSESCSIYYSCENGHTIQNECPPGTEFNPTLLVCDFPSSAGCTAGGTTASGEPTTSTAEPTTTTEEDTTTPEPTTTTTTEEDTTTLEPTTTTAEPTTTTSEPTTTTSEPTTTTAEPTTTTEEPTTTEETTPKPTTTTTTTTTTTHRPLLEIQDKYSDGKSPAGDCPVTDADRSVLLADTASCSVYYECVQGVPMLHHCPSGLHFNLEMSICDFPDNVACNVEEVSKSERDTFGFLKGLREYFSW